MSILRTVALVSVMLATSAVLSAQTVKIGSVEVPADCALAKKEHPRLLFTKADLPNIRDRIAKPGLKPIYDKLKQIVDEQMGKNMEASQMLVPLGLLYHITGDEKYGQACRAVTLKGSFGFYATEGVFGYDLVYNLLTPEERSACEAKMLAHVQRGSAESTELTPWLNALAMWGSGTNDTEVANGISMGYKAALARKIYLDKWAADRGGDGNSHDYIGQHEYVGTMSALQAWRASTGQDLFEGFNWAKAMGPYYIYNILPGNTRTTHIGVDGGGQAFFPWETGAEALVSIAQAKWQDGLTGWWVRNTVCGGSQPHYYVLFKYWGMVLFYNPDVPNIAPSQMPQDMLFKTRGYLAMRSDWGNDATYVHFACGRFELDSRNCCHNNSFIIYRKAYLACDTGSKWGNNEENTTNSDGQHYSKWFPQTIAHNSITIGTTDNIGKMITTMCGGQVGRVPPEMLQAYGMPVSEENKYTRQAGEIKAYETSPEFAYVVGDARCSYDPKLVKGFTRQFLYVRPSAVVIFDRVDAVNANDPKRWYLHTMEQPQCIDGELTADTTVHPDGHFLAGGKTLRSPHGGSVLFSKTVLPENAIIRVLGGKGHQFEVNGINYDMKDPWYQSVGTPAFQENVGLGWWRAEVEPQNRQNNDVFLHVLWATDDTAKEMFPVEKIEKDGQVGAKFTVDGSEVEVTFAKAGEVAGHIKITKGGKVICDRSLATKIEDNYQKWSSDPRFKDWMTNPYLRSAIGEKDQDLFKAGK